MTNATLVDNNSNTLIFTPTAQGFLLPTQPDPDCQPLRH